MKSLIVCSSAVLCLTALSACAPYNGQKDYGNGQVTLDGPLRKNVTFVKGSTTFVDATPAGMASQVQAAGFAAPRTSAGDFGITNVARSVVAPTTYQPVPTTTISAQAVPTATIAPVTSGFVAPINAAPSIPTATFPQQGVIATNAVTQQVNDVRVPPAFINAGQSANLQTRRVGDAGIVVFSNLIQESVAKAAASRSCAQEGKSATPTDAVSVATGVMQLNFSCG